MSRVALRHLSSVPITNGLGLAAEHSNPEWPRYVRTTDIASPHSLRVDTFASQPPHLASAAMLEQGDILMTAAGATIGKSTTFEAEYPACFAGFLVRFRPNEKVVSRFIAYWMQSSDYWDQINVGAVRSTIDNFSARKYRSLLVPMQPLPYQQAIADFLDRETARIDTLIAKQEQLIARLHERRHAVWAHAAESASREWPSVALRRVIDSIADGPFGSSLTSSHYSETGARVIRLGNIGVNEFRDEDHAYIPQEYFQQLSAHEARAGDVIVAGLGDERMPLGRAAVLPEIGPAIVKADCYRLRLRSGVNAEYLAWVLSTPQLQRQFSLLARGATRARLNTSVAQQAIIPLPPLDEQRRIVAYLDEQTAKIDALIAKAECFIELAKERRAALITAAVTGRLDVTAA